MKVKQIIYNNAIRYRLPNRRVTVIDLGDDGIGLEFRRLFLEGDLKSQNVNIVNGKITITSVKLSIEAAYCLMGGLVEILTKKQLNTKHDE